MHAVERIESVKKILPRDVFKKLLEIKDGGDNTAKNIARQKGNKLVAEVLSLEEKRTDLEVLVENNPDVFTTDSQQTMPETGNTEHDSRENQSDMDIGEDTNCPADQLTVTTVEVHGDAFLQTPNPYSGEYTATQSSVQLFSSSDSENDDNRSLENQSEVDEENKLRIFPAEKQCLIL